MAIIHFHGTENEYFVKDAMRMCPNIEFFNIGVPHLDDYSYNTLLKNHSTWQYFQSQGIEKILLFQLDAILLRNDIEEFFKWDYIGAPWKRTNDVYKGVNEVGARIPALPPDKRVGNGGLSLRSVKPMANLTQNGLVSSPEEQEDVFFVRHLSENVYSVADIRTALDFSQEVPIPELKRYNTPFGLHQAWLYEKGKKLKPSTILVTKMLLRVYGKGPRISLCKRDLLYFSF